jgi:hypothetical protein
MSMVGEEFGSPFFSDPQTKVIYFIPMSRSTMTAYAKEKRKKMYKCD